MRRLTSSAEYIWHHRHGRLAILLVLIGATGLVFHFWTAAPLLLALPRLTFDAAR